MGRRIMNLIESQIEETRIKGLIPSMILVSDAAMDSLKGEVRALKGKSDEEDSDIKAFMNLRVYRHSNKLNNEVVIVTENSLGF